MPGKNVIKSFYEGGVFHIYNRGIDKRNIFLEERDYYMFLYLFKKFLSPSFNQDKESGTIETHFLSDKLDLLCFILMANHFHLIFKIKLKDAITQLMRRVMTTYAIYFNKKVGREGSLFQGIYRAVEVKTDEQLVHLSRYAHANCLEIGKDPFVYPYSSLPYYLKEKRADWIKPELILGFFDNDIKVYREFTQGYQDIKEEDLTIVGNLILE